MSQVGARVLPKMAGGRDLESILITIAPPKKEGRKGELMKSQDRQKTGRPPYIGNPHCRQKTNFLIVLSVPKTKTAMPSKEAKGINRSWETKRLFLQKKKKVYFLCV